MILDLPYYSQTKDTKNPEWKKGGCGIAALKMVLDFYKPTNLTIDELYQKGLDINGFLENVGWYHHSLVLIAKGLGYKGMTRSWNIADETKEKLSGRGFEKNDLLILKNQLEDEGLYTLKKELSDSQPLIVSVTKNFIPEESGHLVVLIGFEEDGFLVNDPFDDDRPGEKIKISFEDFKKVWSKRAIFIQNP